eukprot:gene4045-4329_t
MQNETEMVFKEGGGKGTEEKYKPEDNEVLISNPSLQVNRLILVGFISGVVFFVVGIIIGFYAIPGKNNTDTKTVVITQTVTEPSYNIINTPGKRAAMISCLQSAITNHTVESLVLPQSPQYYNESQVFSKFYQNFPIAIVNAAYESTVSKVLVCGGKYGIAVTPRCGGHGNAGNAVQTGAVTLDVKLINQVTYNAQDYTVKVGAGNTAGRAGYYLYQQSNGKRALAVGQKPTVGISGLTLGGGFGFSTRKYGLLCDMMASVRGVLTNGTIVTATANNSYSDLYFASCGGGGGSFFVATQFEFRTMNVSENVTMFHYYIPISSSNWNTATTSILKYQNLSYAFDPRATLNLEILNSTTASITGIFYGTPLQFQIALAAADPSQYFNFFNWRLEYVSYLYAIINLIGWPAPNDASALIQPYDSERNYYQFKSYFLLENLSQQGVRMLLEFFQFSSDGKSAVIWEFQSLGGPQSEFSKVSPLKTAMSHRNARHCLMLKSWGPTLEEGEKWFGVMSNFSYSLAQ